VIGEKESAIEDLIAECTSASTLLSQLEQHCATMDSNLKSEIEQFNSTIPKQRSSLELSEAELQQTMNELEKEKRQLEAKNKQLSIQFQEVEDRLRRLISDVEETRSSGNDSSPSEFENPVGETRQQIIETSHELEEVNEEIRTIERKLRERELRSIQTRKLIWQITDTSRLLRNQMEIDQKTFIDSHEVITKAIHEYKLIDLNLSFVRRHIGVFEENSTAGKQNFQEQSKQLLNIQQRIDEEKSGSDRKVGDLARVQAKFVIIKEKRNGYEQQIRTSCERLLKQIRKVKQEVDLERNEINNECGHRETLKKKEEELITKCQMIRKEIQEEEKRKEIMLKWELQLDVHERKTESRVARDEFQVAFFELELQRIHQQIQAEHQKQSEFEAKFIRELNSPVESIRVPEFKTFQSEVATLKLNNRSLCREFERKVARFYRSQKEVVDTSKVIEQIINDSQNSEQAVRWSRQKRIESTTQNSILLESRRIKTQISFHQSQICYLRSRILSKTNLLRHVASSLDLTSCGTDAVVFPHCQSTKLTHFVSHFQLLQSQLPKMIQTFQVSSHEHHECPLQTWFRFIDQETTNLSFHFRSIPSSNRSQW
jgi:chromosome segregation ATPase